MAGFGFSKVATIGLVLLPFVLCSFIIFGGLKMMRLEAYGVAIGASILAMKDREIFSAYLPTPKGPVFMGLIQKTFGKDQTTRTWDTVAKVVR